jgi:hypothetical protein
MPPFISAFLQLVSLYPSFVPDSSWEKCGSSLEKVEIAEIGRHSTTNTFTDDTNELPVDLCRTETAIVDQWHHDVCFRQGSGDGRVSRLQQHCNATVMARQ